MKIIGIHNPYNLCYLNSILQLLFNVKPLNNNLSKSNDSSSSVLIKTYKDIIEYINLNNEDIVIDNEYMLDSTEFKKCIKCLNDEQYDAHEILMLILNKFHDNLKKKNRINDNFETKFVNKITLYAKIKWALEIEEDTIINDIFKGQ